MKAFLSLVIILPSLALANPFDNFVGEYDVNSDFNLIVDSDNCASFADAPITSVKIKKSDYGFKATHVVVLERGVMASQYVITEYHRNMGIMNPTNTYAFAKTTGDDDHAQNERGFVSPNLSSKFVIKINKNGKDYVLEMIKKSTATNRTDRSCEYEINLSKK